jgi:hypothetical protein
LDLRHDARIDEILGRDQVRAAPEMGSCFFHGVTDSTPTGQDV